MALTAEEIKSNNEDAYANNLPVQGVNPTKAQMKTFKENDTGFSGESDWWKNTSINADGSVTHRYPNPRYDMDVNTSGDGVQPTLSVNLPEGTTSYEPSTGAYGINTGMRDGRATWQAYDADGNFYGNQQGKSSSEKLKAGAKTLGKMAMTAYAVTALQGAVAGGSTPSVASKAVAKEAGTNALTTKAIGAKAIESGIDAIKDKTGITDVQNMLSTSPEGQRSYGEYFGDKSKEALNALGIGGSGEFDPLGNLGTSLTTKWDDAMGSVGDFSKLSGEEQLRVGKEYFTGGGSAENTYGGGAPQAPVAGYNIGAPQNNLGQNQGGGYWWTPPQQPSLSMEDAKTLAMQTGAIGIGAALAGNQAIQGGVDASVAGYQPYTQAGENALASMSSGDLGQFGDPSYDFRLAEQERALNRNMAGMGKFQSGARLDEIMRRSGEMASQEYGNSFNRANQMAQMGYGAQSQVGNALMQGGIAQGQTYMGMGNAVIGGMGDVYGNVGSQSQPSFGYNTPQQTMPNFQPSNINTGFGKNNLAQPQATTQPAVVGAPLAPPQGGQAVPLPVNGYQNQPSQVSADATNWLANQQAQQQGFQNSLNPTQTNWNDENMWGGY